MKTLSILLGTLTISGALSAQCLTISCNSNIATTNDPAACGAVVTYPAPTVQSYTCTIPPATDTFYYTGAQQTFVVPAGVTTVTIQTWGAQGGSNWVNNTNFGGYVAGDVSVTPGSTLYVYVGGQATTTVGGFNGGGSGEGAGKGGGGGTDVRQGGTTYADRVICAGGGGGAGYWSSLHVVGGQGGGLTGGNGYRDPNFATNPGGKGGTQTAGGADGTCVSFNVTACAGGFGYGGSITGCGCEVYGGGGGWYGGAASGNCRGGGGGSGYAIPTASNVTMSTGVRQGNGMVVISYAGGSGSPTITQTAGLASGSTFPVGVTTNTFIGDDGFGNTDTCSFTITVTDTEAPSLNNIPLNIVQGNDATMCGAVVTWIPMGATDNCTVDTIISNIQPGSFFPVGTTWVTYVATDAAGLTDTAMFSVTITDGEAPTISCGSNITVSMDSGMCSASNVVLGNVTAMDNCGATITNNAPSVFPAGTTTVTFTATDLALNSSTCSIDVTVVDNEAPVLTACPQNIIMCPGVVQFQSPNATDNCSATVTQISGPTSGSVLTAGSYTVVFAASDAGGNSDSCIFTINVNANPTIAISNPDTVCVNDGNFALVATPAGGTWSGPALTGNIFSPSAAGNGTQIFTYSYTDTSGCSASATDSMFVSLCTGLNEFGQTQFNMYPNPASAAFTFNCAQQGVMEMLDASGKVVLTKSIVESRTEIDINGIATGAYMIRFTSASGAISTGRLQVQK